MFSSAALMPPADHGLVEARAAEVPLADKRP